MSPQTLLIKSKPELAEICRRFNVQELSLFGSALRTDFRPDSDIDLLVEFKPDASVGLLDFSALQIELESLLQRKVDLVSKQGLKPVVRDRVLENLEPLYAG